MKYFLLFVLAVSVRAAEAQKIDSIYVNLYTDSLKKGTLNYINIDGLLSNGRYLPLDSSDLAFSASAGKFIGNCLWIDQDFKYEKVTVKVVLKKSPAVFKQFDIYVKKKPDNEKLKTAEEILTDRKRKSN
ncbi:MAG: hypothetical protein WKI04_00125 [Ferruginibacter sp.]